MPDDTHTSRFAPMEALLRRVVLIASVAMVVLWLVLHGDIFLATADDRIRCAVGGVFALLIILRGKARSRATALPAWRMPRYSVRTCWPALS